MERQVYEFIAAQTGEKIVQRKECPNCGQEFAITDKDLEFYSKVSPVFHGTKYEIPAPTLCSQCREQRRISFRNLRKFYKRKCDLTWKPIISIYDPKWPYKVYEQNERWSDKWNALDYGKNMDFARPFFQQIDELLKVVPCRSLSNDNLSENSPYVNFSTECKDCYMIFDSGGDEKCCYGQRYLYTNNSIDCFVAIKSSNCYECCNVSGCDTCFYCIDTKNSRNWYFLYWCDGCRDCLFCSNLHNKQYCIYNKQYTKEEYEKEFKQIFEQNNYTKLQEMFYDFQSKSIVKNLNMKAVENGFGNNLQNAKNSSFVFEAADVENVKYARLALNSEDVYDTNNACCNTTLCYEVWAVGINMYGTILSNDV